MQKVPSNSHASGLLLDPPIGAMKSLPPNECYWALTGEVGRFHLPLKPKGLKPGDY